jgi:hypothetical protein
LQEATPVADKLACRKYAFDLEWRLDKLPRVLTEEPAMIGQSFPPELERGEYTEYDEAGLCRRFDELKERARNRIAQNNRPDK